MRHMASAPALTPIRRLGTPTVRPGRSPTFDEWGTDESGTMVKDELLALSDPDAVKGRVKTWLKSDSRAQQLWGELENLGIVARCEANKELLKTLVPLAQYVLGLELQQLDSMRAILSKKRPASRGGRSRNRGESPAPEQPCSPSLDLDLATILRHVGDVHPVDQSPIRRLAKVLKDPEKKPLQPTSDGTSTSTAGDRAALTQLARRVHRVLDVGPDPPPPTSANIVTRQYGRAPPPPPERLADSSPTPSPSQAKSPALGIY